MVNIHVYTSITANYIPKARVLATSLKKQLPDIIFHAVICDELSKPLNLEDEPFDSILFLKSLPIPNRAGWIFSHTVVELCTGVKGLALLEIVERYGAEKVFYFDPDIVVFDRFDELVELLDRATILLTPHLTVPEDTLDAVMDNEQAALKHGVFNLGFLGVRAQGEGLRFANWWSERLLHFCYDDIPNGLFTDQRWADLVPCFFSDVMILRSAAFNVATWNLSGRRASGNLSEGIKINGEPLGFYHFSGFDSGAQEVMLNKYGANSPVLQELRRWYIAECGRHGQAEYGDVCSYYDTYDNDERIVPRERQIYRMRQDVQGLFPDPYRTDAEGNSFFAWVRGPEGMSANLDSELHREVSQLREQLNAVRSSRSWRVVRKVAQLIAPFRSRSPGSS